VRAEAVSAETHGLQSVRWLPERRSQMLPQRSQYFSSMLWGRRVSNFEVILCLPFLQIESPVGGTVAAAAGDGLPASSAKVPAAGLDYFSKACCLAN
jgi:hypothetical protein